MDFLVIEGNIGAGKTTLAKKISVDYNAQVVLEAFADNPFLKEFYKNPKQMAFTLEMSFLAERYSQLVNELQDRSLFADFAVSDYYFMKSLIFASVTLSESEYKLYRKFFDIIYARLPRPNLYVYLYSDADKLLNHIANRGRDYENTIDVEYLEKIDKAYFSFFKQQQEFPILIIDVNNIDFVNNKSDYLKLCDTVFGGVYNAGISRVIL